MSQRLAGPAGHHREGFFAKLAFARLHRLTSPTPARSFGRDAGLAVTEYSGVSSAELQLSRLIRHVEPHGILHGTTVDGRVEMVPIGTTSPSSPAALSWGSHNTNTVSVISI